MEAGVPRTYWSIAMVSATKNSYTVPLLTVGWPGVSEGQYQTVLDVELPQIRMACKNVYGTQPLPKITIAVVGKRHHTRFYPTNANDADMNNQGNPKNGTCVDRGITGEKIFDFFLQAHAALQGTVGIRFNSSSNGTC